MRVMPIDDLIRYLQCACCGYHELAQNDGAVYCPNCNRSYRCKNGILDMVLPEHLDDNCQLEMAYIYDNNDEQLVTILANKDQWQPTVVRQLNDSINMIVALLADRDSSVPLVSIGSGAGFELKQILTQKQFDTVLSSDINPSSTSIVPITVAGFNGELGLFVSEFMHCPVRKTENSIGLCFQALHHAEDSHNALRKLLQDNFTELILVEPVTNRLIELLARFGLAKRVEHTGIKPDWMNIPRIKSLAANLGFDVTVRTWWELPPIITTNKWFVRWPILWQAVFAVTDQISRMTHIFSLG